MIKVSFNKMAFIWISWITKEQMGLNLLGSTVWFYINANFPWKLPHDKKPKRRASVFIDSLSNVLAFFNLQEEK